jgi:hypothetical protein
MDQAHEQVSHFRAVQRAIEQRVLAMQHCAFERALASDRNRVLGDNIGLALERAHFLDRAMQAVARTRRVIRAAIVMAPKTSSEPRR